MKAGIHPNRNQMNIESLQLKRNPSMNVFLETNSPRSNKYNSTKTAIDLLNMYSLPNQSPVKITDQRQ
jgi:hypothetical protein